MSTIRKNVYSVVAALWLLLSALTAQAVIETYEFADEAQHERYQYFVEVLRCPKCQNQNLSGSNSPISEDLRRELYRLLQEEKSDEEIVEFMVARYGDYVLYDPPLKQSTWVLWFGPALFLLSGLVFVLLIVKKRSSSSSRGELSADEASKLATMLDGVVTNGNASGSDMPGGDVSQQGKGE